MIMGDGDPKRPVFLVLGLSLWHGTMFLLLEQIVPNWLQHPRENPRHVRGSARIYDVRMAQSVPKIEKLPHIISARGSQELRSPSLIMAPDVV